MAGFPIWQSVTLPWLSASTRFGLLRHRRERAMAVDVTKRFDVRAPSIWTRMSDLSGGNQQKVILARLALAPPARPAAR